MKGNSKGGKRGELCSVPVSKAFFELRSSVDPMVFVCSLDSEWTKTQMLSMFSSVASVEYSSLIASNEISVEQCVEICRPECQVGGLGARGNDPRDRYVSNIQGQESVLLNLPSNKASSFKSSTRITYICTHLGASPLQQQNFMTQPMVKTKTNSDSWVLTEKPFRC